MLQIRRGGEGDLLEVRAIQEACPEAAQWNATQYPHYDFRVADRAGRIAGFLVARTLAGDEHELLNLAVAPDLRRQGVARALLRSFLEQAHGAVYLEVRESNLAARDFYKSMGFKVFSWRSGYYDSHDGMTESAIVMKFHSC